VPRNVANAYALYLRSAGQGHERAMNLVGRCTEEGWGTSRNPLAAAEWYRRSAEAGYFRGQYNWATVLLKAGELEQAALWFERSATGGTPGVRRAVTALVNDLITRGGAMDAFQKLAHHLNAAALPL
jgi:TPR repeat protein